ncbi:MAG: ABC transporter permease, partial [bacterium]|nr:ABC transporter permease [bacterium]
SSNNFLDPTVFYSYMPAVICLSLGVIAGLTRYTRAELTEVLTSDFMLLARAKGLSRGQATVRHAFRNAMVPIFPMIMGQFIGILGGSLIVENFFSIPGVGQMYIKSINVRDYNFFMFLSMFYVAIGLVASLLVDLSYGIVDPRIRIGAKK